MDRTSKICVMFLVLSTTILISFTVRVCTDDSSTQDNYNRTIKQILHNEGCYGDVLQCIRRK